MRKAFRLSLLGLVGTFALMNGVPGHAQEARGSISGRIADEQAAVIPGVEVAITHTDTNSVSRSVTNETGYFEANLLQPGMYSVSAEAPGFKQLTRRGLELSVGGRIELNLVLEVGAVTETVEVSASAPLLDTTSSTGGRIISRRQILDLPFPDMNPFMMTYFAPGMVYTGVLQDTKPWDHAAISRFNTMGGVGQNQFTIDGAPVNGTDRRVGFAPPSDAVDEFKVETISFDATVAQSTGASINVSTRAGTNTFHGSIFNQHYQRRWNALGHFTRLTHENAIRQGLVSADDPGIGSGRLNDFGWSVGGPVVRDKLFFYWTYTRIWLRNASTTTATVPETPWRTGDFSNLLSIDPGLYTIYDPRSARREGSRVVRDPFPNNQVPILNPMYSSIEPIYPLANHISATATADGLDNYTSIASRNTGENYYAMLNRIDYNLNDRHRIFGRWFWNDRHTVGSDWSFETRPGLNRTSGVRIDKGVGIDHVWAMGATGTFNLGVNYNRYSQGNQGYGQTDYLPSDIALPSYLDDKAGDLHQMPRIDFTSINDISNAYPELTGRGATAEIKVGMTRFLGRHSLKWGWNERSYTFAGANRGYTSGRFIFDNSYVRRADNDNTSADHALDWASFMLGVPSTITIDSNDTSVFTTRYRALYFQDDLRVTNKLRLSLALRYEREAGIRERFNRALAGGFLYDAPLPITDVAQAAYAANPLAELPASQFQVLGGTQYLSDANETYTNGTHKLLPRISAVYQFTPKTVVRVGYGWFYDTFNNNNFRPSQDGFSQPTSTIVSSDLGLNFCCGIGPGANLADGRTAVHDPFPVRADGSRYDQPYRDSLGLMAFAGRNTLVHPREYEPAFQQRWRLSVQREIMSDLVLDISYNGSYARIPIDQPVNFLPGQYWATGNTRNQAVENDMNRNVPNPFHIGKFASLQSSNPTLYTYMSRTPFFVSQTIRKHALLRQFPHMGTVTGLRPGEDFDDTRGVNRYHDLQLLLEKRYSRGLLMSFMYTRSYGKTSDYYYNEFDGAPTWRNSDAGTGSVAGTRPHRLTWTAIYELPFGNGKRMANTGLPRALFGNWQLGGVYQYQAGPLTTWGNVFYYGDLDDIASHHKEAHANDIHAWIGPDFIHRGSAAPPAGFTGFEARGSAQPGTFHARAFPLALDQLRADGIRQWDVRVQRTFEVTERVRIKFFVDALNLTNHTNFAVPNTTPTNANFGRVTAQNGKPRNYQFTLRIEF